MSELGKKVAQRIRGFADAPSHHSLYEHQLNMLHAVADHFDGDKTNGTVKSATGTGKTYSLGAMAVASDVPTVIITPRKLIGEQTINTFMDGDKFDLDVAHQVGLYDSDQPALDKAEALGKKILVTTYPSFIKLVKSGKISADPSSPNYRGNIILDEAHRAAGDGFRAALAPFIETSLVTAWTATDGFMNGSTVNERLFGEKGRIYTLELRDAVEQGRLCHAIKPIAMQVNIDGEAIEALRKKNADYPNEALERFATNKAVQEHALRMYLNYEDEETGIRFYGKPLIVNTSGVKAATETAALFNSVMGEGQAVVVSGDTPPEKREQIFEDYKNGKIKVLCAADLLIEGFDSKDVSVVFSLRPSQSPWLVEQMLGRGARKQSDEYYDRYGHDKQLFAVNFFAKGMEPLLFNQVLGGEVKSKLPQQPRLPAEGRQPDAPFFQPIDSKGVEITSYVSAEEFETVKTQVVQSVLPRPPYGMIELHRAIEVSHGQRDGKKRAVVQNLFSSCAEQIEAGESAPTYNGAPVECGYYRDAHGDTQLYVSRANVDALGLKQLGREDNMLTLGQFKAAAGLNADNAYTRSRAKLIDSLFQSCEQQISDGADPITWQGQTITCGRVSSIDGKKSYLWVDQSHIASLGLAMPPRERPANMLTLSEFSTYAGYGFRTSLSKTKMLARIKAIFGSTKEDGGVFRFENKHSGEFKIIPAGRYTIAGKPALCIDQAYADELREELSARTKEPLVPQPAQNQSQEPPEPEGFRNYSPPSTVGELSDETQRAIDELIARHKTTLNRLR